MGNRISSAFRASDYFRDVVPADQLVMACDSALSVRTSRERAGPVILLYNERRPRRRHSIRPKMNMLDVACGTGNTAIRQPARSAFYCRMASRIRI
jgi:hypothetical protein